MSRFFKKLSFGKLSVKGEIIFLASFFTLLILIIFVLLMNLLFLDTLNQNARRSIKNANSDVINYMNNYFTNISGILSVLSQNKDVINAVNNEQSKKRALELFDLFAKAFPSIDFLFSGYENGFLVINDYTPPEGFDSRNRPWYTEALDNMPEFSTTPPYQEANSREWVFATSKALINSENEFMGVVSTEFNNKTIISLLEFNQLFETQRSYILNKAGTMLCHPDESVIGLDTADIFGIFDEELGFFEYDHKEKASWGYYEKMPLTGWTIVTAVDKEEIRKPIIKTIYVYSILTLMFSLMLGIILYYIFHKRLALPIKKLQKNVDSILRGKEPERQAYRYSNYEITQIAKGIEQLTQTSLNKKKNELSVIIESSTDAILFLDEEQRVSNYNTNFKSVWGISEDDLNHSDATRLFEMMADKLMEQREFQKEMKKLVNGEETVKDTVTLKNGRVYEVYSCPVIQNGSLSGRLFTYYDITDQKVLEENIRKAKEAAEDANRAKSDFLANMSHEIRTPLSGVIGYTELLKETPLDDKQQQYVTNAYKSAQTLFSIINDILDFSKIEAGHMDMEYILTDIIQLTHDAVDVLKYTAVQKNIALVVTIQPEIPRFGKTDPMRLKQVLINLISNAVKFTENGTVNVDIQFEKIDERMGTYEFRVKDTGIGISKQQQGKLFKAFSQADSSTTRKYGGTGLGLVISNYIVEKMGGKITFESEKDQGSTFYFSLRTEYEYGTLNDKEKTHESSEPMLLEGISPRIMIVEDSRINMMLEETILRNMIPKVDVIKAHDGRQAVEKARQMKPDLILMDVQMPEMNGLEASREIRKFNTRIPIIALTAGVVKDEIEKCYEAGMNGFLAKPIDNSALFKILKEKLEK